MPALTASLWAWSVTDYLKPDEAVNRTTMRVVASPELTALTEQLRTSVAAAPGMVRPVRVELR